MFGTMGGAAEPVRNSYSTPKKQLDVVGRLDEGQPGRAGGLIGE
jgi:hypothetical protein